MFLKNYRNVFYKVNKNGKKWSADIYLWKWGENGERILEIIPYKSTMFVKSPIGEFKSIFNEPLEKLTFDTSISRAYHKKTNLMENDVVYGMLNPERGFLFDYFKDKQCDEAKNFSLRTHFIDIEIAIDPVTGEFPEPWQAKFPINVLTVFDSELNEYHVWVLLNNKWSKELTENSFQDTETIKYKVFRSEHKLLQDYLNWHQKNYPDVITGWNIDRFDTPYIFNRVVLLLGADAIKKWSPVEHAVVHERMVRDSKKGETIKVQSIDVGGITFLDYLFLYKDKFGPPSKQSYKLNAIGEDEVGVSKIHFEESMKIFYVQKFREFVEYNIRDVEIVVLLDKKLKFINLTRVICNFGYSEYSAIYSCGPYIYGAINDIAHKRNLVLPSHNWSNVAGGGYEGAFVFDPLKKPFRCGLISIDLNSLYPNIFIQNNISPETKVGKIIEEDGQNTVIRLVSGKIVTIPHPDLRKTRCSKYTISENKVLYLKREVQQGIIPEFLQALYNRRKATKSKMIKAQKEIVILKKKLNELEQLKLLEVK